MYEYQGIRVQLQTISQDEDMVLSNLRFSDLLLIAFRSYHSLLDFEELLMIVEDVTQSLQT